MSVPSPRPGMGRPGGVPRPGMRPGMAPGASPAARTADPFAAASGAGSEFSFDLTGVQAGAYQTLSVGVHPAQCAAVTRGQSNAGNPKVVWTFNVLGGPDHGKQGQMHQAVTQKAIGRLAQTIESLGIGQSGGPVSFTESQAVGRVCAIIVTMSTGTDGVERPGIDTTAHWSKFANEPVFQEVMERLGLNENGEAV